MSAVSEAGQIAVLLLPIAVLFLIFIAVPVWLARRKHLSAVPVLLATLAAAAGVVFLVASAYEADENPGGGAEGVLGTDVPGLLVPPVVLALLAVLVARRRACSDQGQPGGRSSTSH